MIFYLTHHRAFCEELGRLHALDVSWDGRGSVPLRRKPLQSAMELFGRRPDLTIGSQVTLNRGGVEITLFRGGRDLLIHICKSGSVVISGHRPGLQPDFIFCGQPHVPEAPDGIRSVFFRRDVRKNKLTFFASEAEGRPCRILRRCRASCSASSS